MSEKIFINQERLWQSHMDMAEIGALPNGGNCRLTLTDEDKAAKDLFIDWCVQAGCEIAFDRVGNIFACRPGEDNTKPAVMCGSHLDTQPHGGKFDGIYGVLAGLEVIRTLNDNDIETECPVGVAVWINEEGVRFAPGVAGSGTFAGIYSADEILSVKSQDGCLWGEELQRHDFAGSEEPGSRIFDSFFELHIEQGPILEKQQKTIGVVTGVQGIRWLDVKVGGSDAHAGTTPLELRQDALVSAAQMVIAANRIGQEHTPDARVTVGQLNVLPNGPSTIPGSANFIVDIRHPDNVILEKMKTEISTCFEEIALQQNTPVEIALKISTEPVIFDPECINAVRNAVKGLDYSSMDILSGAGHDSIYIAQVAPTSMIFIPSQGGLSHNEAEYSTPEDVAAGSNVLLHAMLQRARTC